MDAIESYRIWAPDESIWSAWAKPVLFADREDLVSVDPPDDQAAEAASQEVSFAPPSTNRTAIILDLPGPQAIGFGLALCRRGYRPVPLYNGAPGLNAAVPAARIVQTLDEAAKTLKQVALPPDAPPAFLLDSDRFAGSKVMSPGAFDNRWWAFPQDFPSANLLLSRGVRTVLLVQPTAGQPQQDLAHVLLRYQNAGVVILSVGADGVSPTPITVAKPSHFGRFWYRALVLAGLRRNSAGGFGAVIPVPGAGGFG